MAPAVHQRAAAEELKKEGNVLFSKGKFSAAAERYTGVSIPFPWALKLSGMARDIVMTIAPHACCLTPHACSRLKYVSCASVLL